METVHLRSLRDAIPTAGRPSHRTLSGVPHQRELQSYIHRLLAVSPDRFQRLTESQSLRRTILTRLHRVSYAQCLEACDLRSRHDQFSAAGCPCRTALPGLSHQRKLPAGIYELRAVPPDGLQRNRESIACVESVPAGLRDVSHTDGLGAVHLQSRGDGVPAHRSASDAAMLRLPHRRELSAHVHGLLSVPSERFSIRGQSGTRLKPVFPQLHGVPYNHRVDAIDLQSFEYGVPVTGRAHIGDLPGLPHQRQLSDHVYGLLPVPSVGLQFRRDTGESHCDESQSQLRGLSHAVRLVPGDAVPFDAQRERTRGIPDLRQRETWIPG